MLIFSLVLNFGTIHQTNLIHCIQNKWAKRVDPQLYLIQNWPEPVYSKPQSQSRWISNFQPWRHHIINSWLKKVKLTVQQTEWNYHPYPQSNRRQLHRRRTAARGGRQFPPAWRRTILLRPFWCLHRTWRISCTVAASTS